jgi:type IV secretory pathway VirB10-like protein
VLNAAPRRVVRFKRRLLIGIAAIACVAVFGVTWLALKGPAMRLGQQARELYNTERKPTPEGLASLPGSYGQMRPDTPQLGPPLPGDLGRPILERQRQLGLTPGVSMEDQAAQAERQRLAQQALQAREAGVFFQIADRAAPVSTSGAEQGASAAMAGELPPTTDANRLNLDPERDQNNQQRKLDFLDQPVDASIYNRHALQTPASGDGGQHYRRQPGHGPELGPAGSRRRPGDGERLRQRHRTYPGDPARCTADRQL